MPTQGGDFVHGEWWVANPLEGSDDYGPPKRADRISGALREIADGEFALETIGCLDDTSTLISDDSDSESSSSRSHIWGSSRDENCISLLDCQRLSRTEPSPSIAGGHEDWAVGWLATGNAWVTPEAQCSTSWLTTDDLRAWALHERTDNTVSFEADDTATVDLGDETLGTVNVGGINFSLVRFPEHSRQHRWDADGRLFSVNNAVSWKLEGQLALGAVVEEWANCVERFVRFVTMRPSVISGTECRLLGSDDRPQSVKLTLRRLPRNGAPSARDASGDIRPHEFLATWNSFSKHGIDPMQMFGQYVVEVQRGDAYVSMISHLESQDRLLSRGADVALLNGVRSVEAQFIYENPGIDEQKVHIKTKINDAADNAGDVGKQVRSAWSAFDDINNLRKQVAHGKSRPGADFGLRCLGGAWSLQWIQRFHLLRTLGADETAAATMICENPRFKRDLGSLKMWSNEL
ncbi:hypothetical protein [Candidatus Poriferisodalis sp.]|uniref:hypothetical protein n=1 Tax=Candidatus Poriferisodalis sp. TaxID=3101277 RepID=UPI003B5BBFA3